MGRALKRPEGGENLRAKVRRGAIANIAAVLAAAVVAATLGLSPVFAQEPSPSSVSGSIAAVNTIDAPSSDGREPDATAAPFAERSLEPLRIASWHLDAARHAGAITIEPPRIHVWRHTFGAERRSPSRASFDAKSLGADVVLLQGVRRLSDVRLMFPSRYWRVIASRQLLRPQLATTEGASWGNELRTATTAVAVRYRRDLRLAGVQNIPEVVMPTIDPTGAGETAAAIAVRLRFGRRFLWAVSADLPAACAGGSPTSECPARVELNRWIEAKQSDARVILGGPYTSRIGGIQTSPCTGQRVRLAEAEPEAAAAARPHPEAGCLASLNVPFD